MNPEIVLLISEKNSYTHSLYLKSALLECILYRPTGKKILLNSSGVTKTAHSIVFSNLYNIFILMIQVMLVYKTIKVKEISVLNNKWIFLEEELNSLPKISPTIIWFEGFYCLIYVLVLSIFTYFLILSHKAFCWKF